MGKLVRAPRRNSQSVTMSAVAERAGVSLMTVSNVVNGKPVNVRTRSLVLSAIEALGYRPNAAARALASAAPRDIGLMYRNFENAFLSSLLLGALRGVGQMNSQLLVQDHDDWTSEGLLAGIDKLIQRGAKGILIPAPAVEAIDSPTASERISVPVMAVCPGDPLNYFSSVRIDDRRAMRDMTAAVIACGHRRIGFIRPPREFLIGRSRFDGYALALQEAGISFDETLVFQSDLTFESGLAAGEHLLDLPNRPTAIVSSNDDMAAAVISVSHRRGLTVPDDLSVSGFNDGPIASKIWPPLTTVRQPVSAAAERAAALLLNQIGNPETTASAGSVTTEYLEYEIVRRASIAAL